MKALITKAHYFILIYLAFGVYTKWVDNSEKLESENRLPIGLAAKKSLISLTFPRVQGNFTKKLPDSNESNESWLANVAVIKKDIAPDGVFKHVMEFNTLSDQVILPDTGNNMAKQSPKVIDVSEIENQPYGDKIFKVKRHKDDNEPFTINFEAGSIDFWGHSDLTVKLLNQEVTTNHQHESLAVTTKTSEMTLKLRPGSKSNYKIPFGEGYTEKIKSSLGKMAIYIAHLGDQCDLGEIKLGVCPLPTEILNFEICPMNKNAVFKIPNGNKARNLFEE